MPVRWTVYLAERMRTVVTFQSAAFNTSESRDYFINPECYGYDVARWLIARLRAQGVQTDDRPGQEDFGWYFDFEVPEGRHCCVLGFRSEESPGASVWIAWLERSRGLFGSLLGLRRRGIAQSAVSALNDALQNAPEISRVRWHFRQEFDAGQEERGTQAP